MTQRFLLSRTWRPLSGALIFTVCLLLAWTATADSSAVADDFPRATKEQRQATQIVLQLMQQYHYSPVSVDDTLSEQIFDRFLDTLDPQKNFLLASDIEEFADYRQGLDDVIRQSELSPVFDIFERFRTRVEERADFAQALLSREFDYTIDESYAFDREDAEWADSEKALDDLWRKRVKNDVLNLRLAEQSDDELIETLEERYNRMERRVVQLNSNEVFQMFINAYTLSVEPHTSYFSPRSSENFQINMSLSLEGIGASLSTEGEYTVIRNVIAGGPAALSEQLGSDDRIVGVGQGKEDIVDVISWPLNDVVDLIRGPKGSTVRLKVLLASSAAGAAPEVITLVRDKIKLEEQAAKKSVVEITSAGKTQRFGVIDLPTFYLDSAARRQGQSDYRSTTRDVRRLLGELEEEDGGVDGVIIDLRGNGGGSLIEATQLTGLFIKSGPVVQIRNAEGEVDIQTDDDSTIAYDGPLAVLVNRNSASASEIFAAAIQDYGRGIVLGEPTFGKGTVQTVAPLDRDGKLGQLKITMAQFFRVNGDGTQFRGVVPDVLFPTAMDSEAHGERALDNALPWDEVAAARFKVWNKPNRDYSKVRSLHEQRYQSDESFSLLIDELESQQEARERTEISLVAAIRQQENEEESENREKREELYRKAFGFGAASDDDDENDEDSVSDIILVEAANVLRDVIEFY